MCLCLKSQLEFGCLIKLSIKKSSIFYVYIFGTNGAIHCKKEPNTTNLGEREGGGFRVALKIPRVGLFMVATFLCNSFRNPRNKIVSINIFHDFWSNFCRILKNELFFFLFFFNFSRMSNFCHMWTQILVGGAFF